MKKLISILLAAAMLLSLTACGSTAADSSRCERRAFGFMSVDMRFSECRSVFPRSVAVLFADRRASGAFHLGMKQGSAGGNQSDFLRRFFCSNCIAFFMEIL